MICEFVLNIIFNIVEGCLSVLPSWDWNINAGFFSAALDMLRLACYLLPMDTIGTMFLIVNFLVLFRIVISLVKTVWELLPLV